MVTRDGLPLGLAAVKRLTCKKFEGLNARGLNGGKHLVNTARMPIKENKSFHWLEKVRQLARTLGKAARCVHIGDRESDIYELFSECEWQEAKFVLRNCVNRQCLDGQ
ncbi:hypothetical protein [Planctopirus hydrillae]|uniref:Uncharacterized protein n=1 Tax=Planctopirus hydrillae TaxID=1841610 RepID=A0A1C3EFY5_9PLAN|nr:hypothetical protein [Planctopirus hydrillae]ODA32141.1 hypothetical protein A6X21_21760 [Planctopirus hydrillae]